MRGVSKGIVNWAAVAAIVIAIGVQPALAAAAVKTPDRTSNFRSLIRTIIRALDEIHISLPPG